MYNQLLHLYTIKEHLSHSQQGHMSIYITPNGKIFDCRYDGVLSHNSFTEEFYKNYGKMINIHSELDLITDVSEFILDDENFSIKDIRDFYLEQYIDIQYCNPELFFYIKSNCLAIDNLLVQDLGFVKVSINRGELPVLAFPMSIFNNKHFQPCQYDTLSTVLENNFISRQDYNVRRLIKMKEKEVRELNDRLTALKDDLSY